MTLSYGSSAGSFAPLWITKEIGAWDKRGLSVDMRLIETNTAVAAVIGKSVDVMAASAAPVITADVNGNEDLVFVASALNHPILALYTVPSITSAEQLKGKVVASGKPGSPVDYSARVALSLLKLKPSDVELRPVGTSAQITAALLSGQVPAGVEAPPQSFQVEAKGFRLLQGIFKQPYQNVGLIAKRSRLDELANAMPALLEGLQEGILAWNKQPDVAKKVLTKYAKVTDATVLQKTYDFYTKTAPFEPSLQPTVPGIQAMMDFLSAQVPAIKQTKPAQYVDNRFLSKLPKAS